MSAPADRAAPAELAQLATASQWRSGIDVRFRCEAPVATTILGGSPAELMQCTQRVGGWAHVAMVALVNGAVWYADGVLPAAQVMQRSIGVLAGVERADAVAATSGADALLASRLAAKAFSSGDIGQFDALMAAGTRANLADNPARRRAPSAPRSRLQQKALGNGQSEYRDGADVTRAATLRTRAATPKPTPCSPMPTSWRRARPMPRHRHGCCTIAASMR